MCSDSRNEQNRGRRSTPDAALEAGRARASLARDDQPPGGKPERGVESSQALPSGLWRLVESER